MIEPLQIYRHFKGNLYQIICVAENSENGKSEVIYRALYGECKIYARDMDMFLSDVDKEKYPEAEQKKRFELVTFDDATKGFQENNSENVDVKMPETEETTIVDEKPSVSEQKINPVLLKFLEAEGYSAQLECLSEIREELTEEILIPIELSLGMEEQTGDMDRRYRNIKNHICLKQRYEKTSR